MSTSWVAGVDEAGRGPLAGPVVAAACILREGVSLPGLTDSKKLTAAQRDELYGRIVRGARAWAIAESSVDEILSREASVVDEVVARAARLKAEVVSADERESGRRLWLNYGHTVGHAVETLTRFGCSHTARCW